jgi:hypothetical protein
MTHDFDTIWPLSGQMEVERVVSEDPRSGSSTDCERYLLFQASGRPLQLPSGLLTPAEQMFLPACGTRIWLDITDWNMSVVTLVRREIFFHSQPAEPSDVQFMWTSCNLEDLIMRVFQAPLIEAWRKEGFMKE